MRNCFKLMHYILPVVLITSGLLCLMGAKKNSTPKYLSFRVVAFEADSLHFDYDDGLSEWFSGTKVELLNPKYSKTEFWIFHENSLEEDSPWRRVGETVYCKYSDELFESLINSTHFFSGVLEIIEE